MSSVSQLSELTLYTIATSSLYSVVAPGKIFGDDKQISGRNDNNKYSTCMCNNMQIR